MFFIREVRWLGGKGKWWGQKEGRREGETGSEKGSCKICRCLPSSGCYLKWLPETTIAGLRARVKSACVGPGYSSSSSGGWQVAGGEAGLAPRCPQKCGTRGSHPNSPPMDDPGGYSISTDHTLHNLLDSAFVRVCRWSPLFVLQCLLEVSVRSLDGMLGFLCISFELAMILLAEMSHFIKTNGLLLNIEISVNWRGFLREWVGEGERCLNQRAQVFYPVTDVLVQFCFTETSERL